MNLSKSLALAFLFVLCFHSAKSQEQKTYVIVHGAWGGGWAFQEVDSLMTAEGGQIYRPTLTGQGERVHLMNENVGLETHIMDIVNTVLFEELTDIILVGHSYGGMVITGVADRIPERIQKLVYLDAMVPENGESVTSISGNGRSPYKIENGGVVAPWVAADQSPPKDVPHPYKTWTDEIVLENPARLEIPTTYILTVDKGKKPEEDGFAKHAERASKKGWPVYQLEADHNAQWSAPKELSEMLLEIGQQ